MSPEGCYSKGTRWIHTSNFLIKKLIGEHSDQRAAGRAELSQTACQPFRKVCPGHSEVGTGPNCSRRQSHQLLFLVTDPRFWEKMRLGEKMV